jgi:hypothetical protein
MALGLVMRSLKISKMTIGARGVSRPGHGGDLRSGPALVGVRGELLSETVLL